MNLFETIIANIIFAITPLLIYFFYLIFEKNQEQKENNLFFDIALLSSLYLLLNYSPQFLFNPKIILLNIPLILAFLKQRKMMIVIISLVIVFFSKEQSGISWLYYVIQYGIYYLLYLICYKKNKKRSFINLFLILKTLAFLTSFIYTQGVSMENMGICTILYLVFILCLYISLQIFSKCEDVSVYFINVQSQEQEKKLKSNLFRITHEIKNPIAVCKGYLDMFDVDNKEHVRKYIPIIKEEMNRTLLLLQDYLSISNIRLDKDYMDMNLLIEDVMNNFNLMMKGKNITKELELLDDEIYIMGDYNRLTQVLVNLLKNSMEAIPMDKTGHIRIQTKIDQSKFYVEIEDNGDGIKEEVLKKMEEPFFTTKINGTGLGVSLSNEIIKAHHGKLIYDSIPYQGTKVKIWLPIEE